MFNGAPGQEEIFSATRTTSGTLVTIPAGKWYSCDISLSATVAVAGASSPTVTVNGTNAAPTTGTVVARLNIAGLALTTVSDSNTISAILRSPLENSITLDFTPGANGTSSATVNGFIFG